MSNFRGAWLWVCVIVAAWCAPVRGQEPESAEALLKRAYETLTGLPHLELTMTTRNVTVVDDHRPEGGYRLLNASYQRVGVTHRQADDWRVVSQREREVGGRTEPERTLVFGKTGALDATLLLLNVTTREPVRTTIPAALFRQEILERAGSGLRSDVVLGALLFNRAETGMRALGLDNVSRSGTDEKDGVRLARLTGSGTGGVRVTAWIDESTGLISRTVFAFPDTGSMRRLTETVYFYDLGRGADQFDYDLDEAWAAAKPGFSASAGFAPVEDLLASASAAGNPSSTLPRFRPDGRPSLSDSGAPSSPVSPAGEAQLLTSSQMESIVLVEGDDGVGSGFVARIRDVDFVVTNQHVIGGNDKVRVTTVRGVPIKVGAIFGAVGRDIAILRIEGENTVPALKISEDPVKTTKLGDRVAVVGNRRGGGVATQVSGVVRGIGPDKIEVDAPFQPGNSGSPIVHVASGEVIGLATYSLTRRLDALDRQNGATSARSGGSAATEQRWFGHRADGVARWETIDQAKWRVQAKRVADFSEDSEAIYYAMNGRFKEASSNPRVRQVIDRFEERVDRLGSTQTIVAQEVQELFRGLRALAESGTKDMKTGDYYDYFRTNMYWETSITEQLRAREEIARRLDKASENTAAFLAKVRR